MYREASQPVALSTLKRMKINLRPDYQRGLVWKLENQQMLIDTILNNYYIPEVIFAKKSDDRNKFDVIDGQQRVNTILKFLSNQIKIKDKTIIDNINLSGKIYDELPEDVKECVNSYTISVVKIEGTTKEIEDMFRRLQMGAPLKNVEARNSYSGNIKNFIKQILDHKFFRITCSVNEKNNKRMKWNEIAEQLIIYELYNIHNTTHTEIKKIYEQYNDIGLPENIKNGIITTLDYLFEAIKNKGKKSYFKKSEIQGLYLIASEQSKKDEENMHTEDFGKWFIEFEARKFEERAKNKNERNDEFDKYLEYITHGTDKKDNIQIRKEILERSWETYFNQLIDKQNNVYKFKQKIS